MSIKPGDGDFTKENIYADFDPAILIEKGLEAQAIAQTLALPHIKSGEYEGSFEGFLEYASNGHPYYRLYNDDPASLSIEFGTAHAAGQHILGRTMDALGDDHVYVDTSKLKSPLKEHTAEETKAHQAAIDEARRLSKKAKRAAARKLARQIAENERRED